MTDTYVSGRVVKTRYHGLTYYGNPMMSIMLDSHPLEWFRISDNSMLVYGIELSKIQAALPHFRSDQSGPGLRLPSLDRAQHRPLD